MAVVTENHRQAAHKNVKKGQGAVRHSPSSPPVAGVHANPAWKPARCFPASMVQTNRCGDDHAGRSAWRFGADVRLDRRRVEKSVVLARLRGVPGGRRRLPAVHKRSPPSIRWTRSTRHADGVHCPRGRGRPSSRLGPTVGEGVAFRVRACSARSAAGCGHAETRGVYALECWSVSPTSESSSDGAPGSLSLASLCDPPSAPGSPGRSSGAVDSGVSSCSVSRGMLIGLPFDGLV